MTTASAPTHSTPLRRHILTLMRPIIRWLVRAGIGHNEFAALLKPMFLQMAKEELLHKQQKINDSAISLLSGLHRKDVRTLDHESAALAEEPRMTRATPVQQLVTRWLGEEWAMSLPLNGVEASFEKLALSVSRDVHPRALLRELERLGVAEIIQSPQDSTNSLVRLCHEAFIPDRNAAETCELVAANLADHASAAVHNLTAKDPRKFLEQAVFVDGLTADSARQLEIVATQLWKHIMKKMVAAATPLCEKDEKTFKNLNEGQHSKSDAASSPVPPPVYRLRMGMFCFTAEDKNQNTQSKTTAKTPDGEPYP